MTRRTDIVAGKKRCSKGKSCGYSCISRSRVCYKDLPKSTSSSLSSASSSIGSSDNGDKQKAKEQIAKVLDRLTPVKADIIDGDVKDSSVNWRASLSSGTSYVGGGEFGHFVTVSPDKLVSEGKSKFPGGVGIKVGEIGEHEVEGIRRAGELGVGPKLISARVSKETEPLSTYSIGVIAMSKVPGKRLKDLPEGTVEGGRSGKAVMEAAAKLHRAGISHNDMHDGNIYVDAKGKVRFVDFGMARLTPKHALAEAMRHFGSLGNLDNVQGRLSAMGVTPREFRKMAVSFGSYVSGGGWSKISDSQAMELIKTFYEGVR